MYHKKTFTLSIPLLFFIPAAQSLQLPRCAKSPDFEQQ